MTTFSEVNAGVAAGGRTGLTFVFCGEGRKVRGGSWVIGLLFVLMLALTHGLLPGIIDQPAPGGAGREE